MRARLVRLTTAQLVLGLLAAAAVSGCGATPPTAPSVNEGGAGGGDAKRTGAFPPFVGTLGLNIDLWDRIVESNVPRSRNEGGFLVATIPVSDRAKPSLNYLFSPANRDISTAAGIDIDLALSTTGTPQFHHDGGAGGLAPNVRAFFWAYDLKDSRSSSARWWSQVYVTLAAGEASLHLDFDPAKWSNVDGQFGSQVPAEFAAARAATVALGVTFGGGSFFGHGVSVSDGTADFILKRFEVR